MLLNLLDSIKHKREERSLTKPASTHLGISVQCQDLLFRVQQLAGICNIDGRFLFVTCQHPNLEASLAQGSDGFGNTVLQPVLDARRSWKRSKRRRLSIQNKSRFQLHLWTEIRKKLPKRWRLVSSCRADSKSNCSLSWMAVSACRWCWSQQAYCSLVRVWHTRVHHTLSWEGAYSSCRSSSNEDLEMLTPHNPTRVRLEAAGFQNGSIQCWALHGEVWAEICAFESLLFGFEICLKNQIGSTQLEFLVYLNPRIEKVNLNSIIWTPTYRFCSPINLKLNVILCSLVQFLWFYPQLKMQLSIVAFSSHILN